MKYLISIILLINPVFSLGDESNDALGEEIRKLEAEIQANEQLYQNRPRVNSLGEDKELKNYINSCLNEIIAPENMTAVKEARDGTALIRFSIYPSGTIKNIETVKSSGSYATDRAIHKVIIDASPCQKFPETFKNSMRKISATRNITYIKASQ